ncbi:NUDIX hydrolase [Salinicoccus sesuvii]|uniref:NUDIX hydrolase n=1 Tax=Salinicoccus sesuvii TaxID=868281 RepID=A0ABV7N921_9STAP
MKPRNTVLGLVIKDNALLLEERCGKHSRGEGIYYRPIGGTIEWSERSSETLKREFIEEIGTEIDIINYVACLENIFEVDSMIGHEITQVYRAVFKDKSLYEIETFNVIEGGQSTVARWISIKEILEGKKLLFPDKLIDLI